VIYLQVKGEGASKAAVSVQSRNGSTDAAESGAVCVDNAQLPVHRALLLDGRLHLRVCQDLIIQHRPIAVHLQKPHQQDLMTTITNIHTTITHNSRPKPFIVELEYSLNMLTAAWV
jgi:hypothetical protein